jgi:putative ABC transport system ATP-binding protein
MRRFGRSANGAAPTHSPNGRGDPYLIDVRQVAKTYPSPAGAYTALRDINLCVSAGEFVAVIGKSGSGKSTLINIVTGIDRPTTGEIFVGGTPLHALGEGQMAAWRGRNVGVVFQFFQLIPTLTVLENVMLPMDFCGCYTPRERRSRAMHLLELVDIADQAHKLPAAVSGGQQQRAAIGRALANDPPILVADEPTGNLDSQTTGAILQLFTQLVAEGKTILIVTHDQELACSASRTVLIADGMLSEVPRTLHHENSL